MKKNIVLICSVILVVVFIVGFSYYSKTSFELYNKNELEQSENDLLNEAVDAFDININVWHISNLEKIDTMLKENFNSDDYNSISQIIYEEYYNNQIDRQPNTIILLNKKLDAIIIISEDSNNSKLCAKIMLDNLDVKDKVWDYQK